VGFPRAGVDRADQAASEAKERVVTESLKELWKFLQDVWREIHPHKGRVTWPTIKSVKVSTAVVILSSVLLSVYISVCDGVLRGILYPLHGHP
jgi:preprotein translocase SecE subunit